MNSFENFQNICRICLNENVILNWNKTLFDSYGVTYKDCYYKYTQLEYLDEDPFSPMLCENCLNILENIHTLVLTALESHKYFAETWLNYCDSNDATTTLTQEPEMKYSRPSIIEFETVLLEEIDNVPIKKNYIHESKKLQNTRKVEKKQREITKSKVIKEEGINLKESKLKTENIDTTLELEDTNKTEYKEKSIITESDDSLEFDMENIHDEKRNQEISDLDVKNTPETETCYSKDNLLLLLSTTAFKTQNNCKSAKENNEQLNLIKATKNIQNKNNKDNVKSKSYNCMICSKVFTKRYKAKNHEKTHRERKEICNVCGLKFYDKYNLQNHMKIHQENREKPYKCEFCDKAFYNLGALNIHKRIHLGQMIPCSLCSKKYCRKVDLERHMRVHNATIINKDIKKINKYFVRCKYCGKSIRSTTYKSHTAAHLEVPLMKCSICDREFYSRSSCTFHMKRIHQKTIANYNNFIICYTTNRISNLYLKQNADLELQQD